jgi:hypothetical protein
MDEPQSAVWKSGMSRRVGIWMAIAAVLQQLLLPGLAAARATAGAAADVIEVCTPAGIVKIAGAGIPARPTEHAGQKHGTCLACCSGAALAPMAGPRGMQFHPSTGHAVYSSAGSRHEFTEPQRRAPQQRGPPRA